MPRKVAEESVVLTVKGYVFDWNEHFCTSRGELTAPESSIREDDIQAYEMTPCWKAVDNADYYEILFNGDIYTKVRDTSLRFEGLDVETAYTFKVRAVNADGCSDWSTCSGTTKRDPLEHAIKGMTGRGSLTAWEDFEERRLFDFATGGDIWYTEEAVEGEPFSLVIDTRSISRLDKLVYLPRPNAGAGTLLKGSIATSIDKVEWKEAGTFEWELTKDDKTFTFVDQPEAKYIRLTVNESRRNNGSGREIYIFRVPGSEYVVSGDINSDGKVDVNDLPSMHSASLFHMILQCLNMSEPKPLPCHGWRTLHTTGSIQMARKLSILLLSTLAGSSFSVVLRLCLRSDSSQEKILHVNLRLKMESL